jgi:type I restriction enzyme M protein
MIREVCGSDDPAVIAQLERWWDKYRVSLRELDQEVVAAEGVMRGYLEELGYE